MKKTYSEHVIFFSYRRNDVPELTARIHARLSENFGEESLFLDIDSIETGADFAHEILQALQSCDIMLVIIGPNWLEISHGSSDRRIDDPMDYLRMEIESSLSRGLSIIPVVIEPAEMPKEDELPNSIQRLSRKQGLKLRNEHFEDDIAILFDKIDGLLIKAEHERNKKSGGIGVVDYFDVVLPTMLRWRGDLASKLTSEANCSLGFIVIGDGGGTWVLVLKPPKPHVHKGLMENVDCSIKLPVERMLDILSGQFDANIAIASGEVQISGDVNLLKVIALLF